MPPPLRWGQFEVTHVNVPSDARPNYVLQQLPWSLWVSEASPNQFELRHQNQAIYSGVLEVFNNGTALDISAVDWRFRHKQQRLEQWCQLQHSDTLSVNMNYYFHQDALVIEYLARNSVPTRLDIRHAIEPLAVPSTFAPQADLTSPLKLWQRRRNGMPSEFLSQTEKTDFFREAFSATQWIVLNKL